MSPQPKQAIFYRAHYERIPLKPRGGVLYEASFSCKDGLLGRKKKTPDSFSCTLRGRLHKVRWDFALGSSCRDGYVGPLVIL